MADDRVEKCPLFAFVCDERVPDDDVGLPDDPGGFVVPPRDFFVKLRESCTRHNVLLIFDEIITGFGRLGERFGADYYGVIPDLIACGKGMSSGYAPLAAVLIQEKVNREFLGELAERREFHHGHTYGGNPVACAAGLAAIRQMKAQKLV